MKTPRSQKKSRKNENMKRKEDAINKIQYAINKGENKATLASLYLHKLIFN